MALSGRKTITSAMLPVEISAAIFEAAETLVADRTRAFKISRRGPKGSTLRPGTGTPLWNTLVAEVRPYLKKRGTMAQLGRLLGLPRQQIHAYFVQRVRMPDAERTLQIIAWLVANREGQPPA